jgi:hypothetical protein
VGPRAGLDTDARGKILSPLPGIEPRSPCRPARSQTLYLLSYPAYRKYNNDLNFICCVWKQCTQAENFSFIHDLLDICSLLLYKAAKQMFHVIESYYNL